MKQWWLALEPRERRMLVLGAVAMAVITFWLAVWEPLTQARESRIQQVEAARQTLAFMEQAVPQIVQLRQTRHLSRSDIDRGRQSLLGMADASAREAGLGGVLSRVEPAGEGRVRLWFEAAPFDALIDWVDRISAQRGVAVPEFSAERGVGAGRVNARLLLEEGVPR